MSNIAEVIGWKHNNQAGMSTVDGVITAFPGGIPSAEDQKKWSEEYSAYLASTVYKSKRAEELAKDKNYKGEYSEPAISIAVDENAQALDDALANIKVCDPAIGSGAFPVGMLTEIIKARKVLELYLDKKLGVYELKRHCIQNSLYGVDIDPGAIEIAKLRLIVEVAAEVWG